MPRQTLHKWSGLALVALKQATSAYSVTAEQVRSDSRYREVVRARHYAWAILRAMGKSYPVIGELCGGYHHTTVMSALERLPASTMAMATNFARGFGDQATTEHLYRARLAMWSGEPTDQRRQLVVEHFENARYVAQAQRSGIQ